MLLVHNPGRNPEGKIKCAHCGVTFRGTIEYCLIGEDKEHWWAVESLRCPDCEKFNLFLVNTAVYNRSYAQPYEQDNLKGRRLIRPRVGNRGPVPPEVPTQYADDYVEACLVLDDSPKASAALSRRCLQHLLRDEEKTKAKDLADQIQEVLQKDKLPSHIATAIDAVRNLGNFAAHPLKSKSTGEIVEVEAGEAEWNLEVLEALSTSISFNPPRQSSASTR